MDNQIVNVFDSYRKVVLLGIKGIGKRTLMNFLSNSTYVEDKELMNQSIIKPSLIIYT